MTVTGSGRVSEDRAFGARDGRPMRLRVGTAVGRGAGGSEGCRVGAGRDMEGFGAGLRSTKY